VEGGKARGSLEVRKAIYEAVDGTASVDVTAAVARQVHNGRLQTVASNDSLGGDPALQHVKRLRLEYTLDGKAAAVVLKENEQINLVSGNPVPGPWRVEFPGRTLTLDSLVSWTERPEPAIRYFSGTAVYRAAFEASEIGARVVLDLGRVDSVAEVTLNGRVFPAAWKYPYEIDVTSALRPGANVLEVRVANVWHNRLVGQSRVPTELGVPAAWASATPGYGPGEPLFSSGLLGPVVLRGAVAKGVHE
jgi:hypothetical protein